MALPPQKTSEATRLNTVDGEDLFNLERIGEENKGISYNNLREQIFNDILARTNAYVPRFVDTILNGNTDIYSQLPSHLLYCDGTRYFREVDGLPNSNQNIVDFYDWLVDNAVAGYEIATTFSLNTDDKSFIAPDLRGRFMKAVAQGTSTVGGFEDDRIQTLTLSNAGGHNHTIDPHNHSAQPHTHSTQPHWHDLLTTDGGGGGVPQTLEIFFGKRQAGGTGLVNNATVAVNASDITINASGTLTTNTQPDHTHVVNARQGDTTQPLSFVVARCLDIGVRGGVAVVGDIAKEWYTQSEANALFDQKLSISNYVRTPLYIRNFDYSGADITVLTGATVRLTSVVQVTASTLTEKDLTITDVITTPPTVVAWKEKIIAPNSKGVLNIRVQLEKDVSFSSKHIEVCLKRQVDNSVVTCIQSNDIDADARSVAFNLVSYYKGNTDPFVVDGYYIELRNISVNTLTFPRAKILITRSDDQEY